MSATIFQIAEARATRHADMRRLISLAADDEASQDRLCDLLGFPHFRPPVRLSDEQAEEIEQ